jgi:hypothetical protein
MVVLNFFVSLIQAGALVALAVYAAFAVKELRVMTGDKFAWDVQTKIVFGSFGASSSSPLFLKSVN